MFDEGREYVKYTSESTTRAETGKYIDIDKIIGLRIYQYKHPKNFIPGMNYCACNDISRIPGCTCSLDEGEYIVKINYDEGKGFHPRQPYWKKNCFLKAVKLSAQALAQDISEYVASVILKMETERDRYIYPEYRLPPESREELSQATEMRKLAKTFAVYKSRFLKCDPKDTKERIKRYAKLIEICDKYKLIDELPDSFKAFISDHAFLFSPENLAKAGMISGPESVSVATESKKA